jgi:hypothetical protein
VQNLLQRVKSRYASLCQLMSLLPISTIEFRGIRMNIFTELADYF